MKDINLLPRGYKRTIGKKGIETIVFVIIFLVSLGLVAGSTVALIAWKGILTVQNDGYEKDIKKYSVVSDVINQNKAITDQLKPQEDFLAALGPKVSQVQYMRYLGGAIPSGSNLKLSSYTYDGSNITINFTLKDYSLLSQYVRNIRFLGVFTGVKLTTIGPIDPKTGISASIQCSVVPAAATTTN